jgi:hypothetical protein
MGTAPPSGFRIWPGANGPVALPSQIRAALPPVRPAPSVGLTGDAHKMCRLEVEAVYMEPVVVCPNVGRGSLPDVCSASATGGRAKRRAETPKGRVAFAEVVHKVMG